MRQKRYDGLMTGPGQTSPFNLSSHWSNRDLTPDTPIFYYYPYTPSLISLLLELYLTFI